MPEPLAPRRLPVLFLIGALGGLLSGMFGVGGGILMVPLLVSLARMDQKRASATSLAAIVPSAIAGSIGYLALGHVDFVAALVVASGAVLGAFLGTALLKRISVAWLRWLFIALLVVIAVRMFLVVPVRAAEIPIDVWSGAGLVALGLIMGVASGLFGIGGGVIAVPVLVVFFGAGDLVAKGTSLLIMVPTGIAGTIGNLRNRMVDLRMALVVGAGATAASFLGVALAVLVPAQLSAALFAVLLVVSAVQLTVGAIRQHRRR